MKSKQQISFSKEKKDSDKYSLITKKHKKVTPGMAAFKNTFSGIVSQTKKQIRKLKPKCKKKLTKLAYEAAQELLPDFPVKLPRVIPVPKTGGLLPLIPIFAGLSAAGSIAGGVAGITKAINEYKAAKKQLQELKRHNQQIEAYCIGKGLHLKPYRDGLGIYVTKKKN